MTKKKKKSPKELNKAIHRVLPTRNKHTVDYKVGWY